MNLLAYLLVFPLLVLLTHRVRSKDVIVPWNSSLLKKKDVFTVLLGDLLVFEPCGDSNSSSLVYTDSRDVFANCTLASDVSSDIQYSHIGNCFNPSGNLLLPVHVGIPGIVLVAFEVDGAYYFFSDFDFECENGLKAVVVVAENRPITDQPPPGDQDSEPLPTGSLPPADSGVDQVITLPLLVTLTTCAIGIAGILLLVGTIVTVICYRRRKRRKAETEEERVGPSKAERAKEPVVPLKAERANERVVPLKQERAKERVSPLKVERAKERVVPLKVKRASERGVPLKTKKARKREAPERVMTPFGEQIKWPARSRISSNVYWNPNKTQ